MKSLTRWSRMPSTAALVAGIALTLLSFLTAYPILISFARGLSEYLASGVIDLGSQPLVPFMNSGLLVVASTVIALFIGGSLAWVVERTDADLESLRFLVPVLGLLAPPAGLVVGWIFLLDGRVGIFNVWLREIGGLFGITARAGPFYIASWPGMILVTATFVVPFVFLPVAAAIRNLDPSLEEAARISGAGTLRILRKITFPAIAPALAAACAMGLVRALAEFTVPVFMGTPARIEMLPTRIYRFMSHFPSNIVGALVLSAITALVIQIFFFLQLRVSAKGRHARQEGKSGGSRRIALGAFRNPVRIVTVGYLLIVLAPPMLALILVSLQPYWSADIDFGRLQLSNFTQVLFFGGRTTQALINSLLLALAGASIGMFLAAIIAFSRASTSSPLQLRLATFIGALPSSLPPVLIGVTFFTAFSGFPFRLYGSPALLILAYLFLMLPQAMQSANAGASSIGQSLVEAARISGSSYWRTFFKIQIPLALRGLLAGWVVLFIVMNGEIAASVFLTTPQMPVIGSELLSQTTDGTFGTLAALAVILTIENVVVYGVVTWLSARFLKVGK